MRREYHSGESGGGSDRIARSHLTDHTVYADLNFKAVIQFLVGLGIIVVLSYIAMWGMFELFESQHAKNDPTPSPTARVGWTPPAVTVQPAPHLDLVEHEAAEHAEIESEIATGERLSIDDAIEKTLQEGLPFRDGTVDDDETPVEQSETDNDNDPEDEE